MYSVQYETTLRLPCSNDFNHKSKLAYLGCSCFVWPTTVWRKIKMGGNAGHFNFLQISRFCGIRFFWPRCRVSFSCRQAASGIESVTNIKMQPACACCGSCSCWCAHSDSIKIWNVRYLLWHLWAQMFSWQHAAAKTRSGAKLRERRTIDMFRLCTQDLRMRGCSTCWTDS